jgi:hypothetical protein
MNEINIKKFKFRFELLEYWKRYKIDGINSLKNLNYTIKSISNHHLFTNITVDIGPSIKEDIPKDKIERSKFNFY